MASMSTPPPAPRALPPTERLAALADGQWVGLEEIARAVAGHERDGVARARLRLVRLGLRALPHRLEAAAPHAAEWRIPTVVRWLDRLGLGGEVPERWRAWTAGEHVELVVAGLVEVDPVAGVRARR